MRTALRMALEGSMILGLASLTAALYCTLRSIRSRRSTSDVERSLPTFGTRTEVRRPVFLSRRDLQ
jgi:hypothetical protein